AARDHALERLAVEDAAADIVDQILQRKSHWQFVESRFVHVTRQAEEFGPRTFLGTDRFIPIRAAVDDMRDIRQRLDIVDDGRRSERALNRRERRTVARICAPALERFEQTRLLAADIRAGAAMSVNLEVEARS